MRNTEDIAWDRVCGGDRLLLCAFHDADDGAPRYPDFI